MQPIEHPIVRSPRVLSLSFQGLAQISLLIGWVVVVALVVSPADVAGWLIHSIGQLILVVLALGLLFLLPGLALLRLLWLDWTLTKPERVGLAVGISVALPPLLLGLARLVGLPWNRWTTIGYGVASLLTLVWPRAGQSWHTRARTRPSPAISWHSLILIGLFGIGLFIRLYIVRDLPVGLWGDSYHHTMITQLLVDNSGLFSSWEPYVPLDTFTYHYGFHANSAFFAWLTGINASQSVILVGQIQSAATILLAYVFTTRLSRVRAAGLWAALLTGFVNTMPAYYVNWGRYTQLSGQIVLIVVLVCWMVMLEQPRLHWRPVLLSSIVTASLVETHYLVTLFAAVFIAAYLLVRVTRAPNWLTVKRLLIGSISVTLVALLFTAPWLLNITRGYWDTVAGNAFTPPQNSPVPTTLPLESITAFPHGSSTIAMIKGFILGLAVLGLLIGLSQRAWKVLLWAVWSLLLILMPFPYLIGLPGKGIISVFTAYIALYITVVPLAGYALGWLQQRLVVRLGRIASVGAIVLIIAGTLWGSTWQRSLIDTQYQLFTPADAAAMEWIKRSTPKDALFLVNMFPAYYDTLFVGADGGWWIPLLTGRRSTVPPITYGTERAATETYVKEVNAFGRALREHPLPSKEAIQLIRAAGIDYIYIGPHLDPSSVAQRIDVQALRYRPQQFPIVYERDGVIIFALKGDL